jgi:hypothetical protein
MKKLLTVLFIIVIATGLISSCGEKIELPTETPFQGNLGDTLYLQLNPPWDAPHGYDFNAPTAIYFGQDTYLYVADTGNDRIIQMDAAGTIHNIIPVENPISISQDELMRLLVVTGDNKVYKIPMGPGGNMQPYVAYDRDYRSDSLQSVKDINMIDETDEFVSITDLPTIDKSYFVAVRSSDPAINNGRVLWFYGSGADSVNCDSLFDPMFTNLVEDTLFNPVVPTGNGITSTIAPNFIYSYESGGLVHLIVCQDSGSYPVHDMTMIWQVWNQHWVFTYTHFPGEGDILIGDLYDRPCGATVDAERNLYIVDSGPDRSCGGFKFSGGGEFLKTFCQPDSMDNVFNNPAGITYDIYGERRTVFFADTGNNRILRFKLSTDLEN